MTERSMVLGAMYFGTRLDETSSMALLDRFVDQGGTWIDTANNYAFWADPSGVGGQSEALIGRWLASRPGMRDRVRISTKVRYQPTIPGRWPESAEGLSGPVIRSAVRESLKRLNTDRLDLYWAHGEDRAVPLEETVAAFGELVQDGLVARLGASNHAVWRVERARRLAAQQGVAGYTALQLRWSYVEPRPGAELPDQGHRLLTPEALDYARSEPGIAMWAYTPLINGAYTRPDRPLPEAYQHPGTDRRLTALAEVADELGVSRNQVVLAWMATGDPAVTPIVGVSTPAQLDEALQADRVVLSSDQRRRLDQAA
ncbi:aldo/keto reductase [Actinoplanes utahensis]|uniref:Oxidoreductase n=1 Tax=Actinoplanes utahensis TaxID=1869 RepID=A0A0A6UH68_ACTUT|nr:aldo/keto reductase [Actinoplanes utahensis]KHD75375.1 oxidoreductase [Actinoplanes utahensis]GIF33715.1 oxidoreductase [Actinoplanes utahensis]